MLQRGIVMNSKINQIRDKIRSTGEKTEWESVRIRKDIKDRIQKIVLEQKLNGKKTSFSEVLERLLDFSKAKDL